MGEVVVFFVHTSFLTLLFLGFSNFPKNATPQLLEGFFIARLRVSFFELTIGYVLSLRFSVTSFLPKVSDTLFYPSIRLYELNAEPFA